MIRSGLGEIKHVLSPSALDGLDRPAGSCLLCSARNRSVGNFLRELGFKSFDDDDDATKMMMMTLEIDRGMQSSVLLPCLAAKDDSAVYLSEEVTRKKIFSCRCSFNCI